MYKNALGIILASLSLNVSAAITYTFTGSMTTMGASNASSGAGDDFFYDSSAIDMTYEYVVTTSNAGSYLSSSFTLDGYMTLNTDFFSNINNDSYIPAFARHDLSFDNASYENISPAYNNGALLADSLIDTNTFSHSGSNSANRVAGSVNCSSAFTTVCGNYNYDQLFANNLFFSTDGISSNSEMVFLFASESRGTRWLARGEGTEMSVVSEVPVPAAAWLFGSALIGLVGFKRKK